MNAPELKFLRIWADSKFPIEIGDLSLLLQFPSLRHLRLHLRESDQPSLTEILPGLTQLASLRLENINLKKAALQEAIGCLTGLTSLKLMHEAERIQGDNVSLCFLSQLTQLETLRIKDHLTGRVVDNLTDLELIRPHSSKTSKSRPL